NQPSRVLRPKPNSLDTAIAVSPSAIRSHATFKIRSRSRSSNRFRGPRCRRAFAISLFSALNSLGLAMPQRCPRPARPSRRGRASTYVAGLAEVQALVAESPVQVRVRVFEAPDEGGDPLA